MCCTTRVVDCAKCAAPFVRLVRSSSNINISRPPIRQTHGAPLSMLIVVILRVLTYILVAFLGLRCWTFSLMQSLFLFCIYLYVYIIYYLLFVALLPDMTGETTNDSAQRNTFTDERRVCCLSVYIRREREREREREFGNERAIGCRRRNDAMPLERRKSGECGDGRIYWDLERRRREQQGGGRQRAFEDEANSLDSPNRSAIQLFLLALFDMETVC